MLDKRVWMSSVRITASKLDKHSVRIAEIEGPEKRAANLICVEDRWGGEQLRRSCAITDYNKPIFGCNFLVLTQPLRFLINSRLQCFDR